MIACLAYKQWDSLHDTDISISKQLTTMQGQLAIMKITQRPWIGAPRVEQISIGGNPEKFTFNLIFKNIGQTPTTGLYIGAKTVDATEWESEGKRVCEKGIAAAKSSPIDFRKFSIVPGDEFMIGDVGANSTSFTRFELEERKIGNPHIVGCVIYRSQFDEDLHHTMFVAPLDLSSGVPKVKWIWSIESD